MSALSVADTLDAAADLLTPEGAWTQGAYGRDANGFAVHDDKLGDAVCLCAVGAIAVASGRNAGPAHDWEIANHRVLELPGHFSIGGWNDHKGRTQAEVVAALRRAASIAREAQP